MLSTTERTFDTPVQLTTVISSLHVAKTDLQSIRSKGWPLAYTLSPDQIWLSLAPDGGLDEFAFQLREQGFSAALTDLVRWAANDGKCCLLIDDHAEPNDRLLIFVD